MPRHQMFHVVFFEEQGWWIAQCLERNLVASARDPKDLQRKLEAVVKVQMEADREAGISPFSALPQAPRRFWQMFQSAQPWRLDEEQEEIPVKTPIWTELVFA